MKRFLISVYTSWCGMEQEYAAYANDESELIDVAAELAYENFNSFNCIDSIVEELYPEVEQEGYTEEMYEHAYEVKGEYYDWFIDEWGEEIDEEEWSWYELVYDGRTEENAKV